MYTRDINIRAVPHIEGMSQSHSIVIISKNLNKKKVTCQSTIARKLLTNNDLAIYENALLNCLQIIHLTKLYLGIYR